MEKKITFDSFIRGVLVVAFILGAFWLLNKLSGVLLPFFIAWLIAYFMYPLVKFFQFRLKFRNRVVSILASMLLIILVLVAAFVFFVPPMINELMQLRNLLIEYFMQGSQNVSIPGTIEHFIKETVDVQFLQQLFSEEQWMKIVQGTVPKLWSILYGSIDFLFSIFASFIILLYIFFILLDYESIADGWVKLVPIKHRKFVQAVVTDVQVNMNRYFRGQALVAFLVGVLFSIGFLIIDFPLAIGFGLFIGALNMVPYLQLIALIPTVILALLQAAETGGNFWWILCCALLVFCVVQVIQDGIIVPKVMGKITGLNPAIILLALSVWGSLLGILGMIIALPLTTIILAYYNQFITYNEKLHQRLRKRKKHSQRKSEIPEIKTQNKVLPEEN